MYRMNNARTPVFDTLRYALLRLRIFVTLTQLRF